MSTTSSPERRIHHGRNIKRYREILGIKQGALAFDLGNNWNQKKISLLENKEEIDPVILEQVSKILNIPMEKLESQDAEQSMVNIQNNYDTTGDIVANGTQNNFNPLEKLMEAFEEIKRLNDENKVLYERMLKEKDEMIARLLKDK